MAATRETKALETWLRANGAYLHPSVHIFESASSGIHMRASDGSLPAATTVASAPHSLALSYLNATVDEQYPVFKISRQKLAVEAIGFFYLITQYLNRNSSFWKPYTDTLPSPESDLTQPLFFETPEDIAWLDGTDVWYTVTARKKIYEEYYHTGIRLLSQAGIDTEAYTWHLFLWAITTFTSRSFSSRSIRPQSGKYWAAYRSSPDGRRQAVLLDMSHSSAEDLHFPVLFPGLDAANHNPSAKVDWTFDPGRFSVALAEDESVAAGDEVFNNYGPKSNGELLIGYGFCIQDNPHDTVAMTLKAPPQALQNDLQTVHAGYFTQDKTWNPQKATFYLKAPTPPTQTSSGLAQRPRVFHELPEPLLELLLYILQHERGLAFEFQERPLAYLTYLDSSGRRYLPHIARMIVQSLAPKYTSLQATRPQGDPCNAKQRVAAIYRDGQVKILAALLDTLKTYTRSLLRPPSGQVPSGPALLTIETFMSVLDEHSVLPPAFLEGVAMKAGTSDLGQLLLAGWEDDIWVLLLTHLLLSLASLPVWLAHALGAYVAISDVARGDHISDNEAIDRAEETMVLVRTAAAALPETSWADPGWSAARIAATGGAIMKHDSFLVTTKNEDGEDEVRVAIYFLFP